MARKRILVFAPGTILKESDYYLPEHPEVVERARFTPIAPHQPAGEGPEQEAAR